MILYFLNYFFFFFFYLLLLKKKSMTLRSPYNYDTLESIIRCLVEDMEDEKVEHQDIIKRFIISFPHIISVDVMWKCFESIYFPEDDILFSAIPRSQRMDAFKFLKKWICISFKRDFLFFYKEENKKTCLRDKIIMVGKKRLNKEPFNDLKVLMIHQCKEKIGNRPKRSFKSLSKNTYRSNSADESPPKHNRLSQTNSLTDLYSPHRLSCSESSDSVSSSCSEQEDTPKISAKTYFNRTYSKAVVQYSPTSNEHQLMVIFELQYGLSEAILKSTGGFLSEDDMSIAQQLTIIEFEIFVKINSGEFLCKNWENEKAKNICKMIDRFNLVSNWIVTVIVREKDKHIRRKKIEKFLIIQKKLFEIQNFNGVMQICAALSNVAVSRLKKSWKKINTESLKKIEKIMSPDLSFANYRNYIKTLNGPIVPFTGILTRDILALDNNPNFHYDNQNYHHDLINFDKLQMIGKTLCEIKSYQEHIFQFPENIDLKNYLLFLPILPDEILWKISQETEQH